MHGTVSDLIVSRLSGSMARHFRPDALRVVRVHEFVPVPDIVSYLVVLITEHVF
jgi:hypothetical protein